MAYVVVLCNRRGVAPINCNGVLKTQPSPFVSSAPSHTKRSHLLQSTSTDFGPPLLARAPSRHHHLTRPSLQRHRSASSSPPSNGRTSSSQTATSPSSKVQRPPHHLHRWYLGLLAVSSRRCSSYLCTTTSAFCPSRANATYYSSSDSCTATAFPNRAD